MKKLFVVLFITTLLAEGCSIGSNKKPGTDASAQRMDNDTQKVDQGNDHEDNNEITDQPVIAEEVELFMETAHFKIFYQKQDEECLEDLSEGLEAAYSKVTEDLDCILDYKVDVTVYPDIELLHEAIGYVDGTGQDDYITAATIGKHIFITSPLNPGPARTYEHMINSSTFHEFTHVVINEITSSDTWPTEVPRWLNEGIASYEGGPPMSLDDMILMVSQRVENGQIPTFENLASYGQDFITSGGYFFTLPAGQFFIETYGFEKVKQLVLSPGNYEAIFEKTEQELWNEWVEYLMENYS